MYICVVFTKKVKDYDSNRTEIEEQIESNITLFREKELQQMFNYSEHLLLVMKYAQARLKEGKPKMVLYEGKWFTENYLQ